MASYDRDGSPTETSKLLAENGGKRRGNEDQPDGERRFLSHILVTHRQSMHRFMKIHGLCM